MKKLKSKNGSAGRIPDMLIESVLRRLLRESGGAPSIDDLAVVTGGRDAKDRFAVLYRPSLFLDSFRKGAQGQGSESRLYTDKGPLPVAADAAVVGFVQVGPPSKGGQLGVGRCYDGWTVRYISGKGFGRILYGLGYALSPSGILMSDRYSVSSSAYGSWSSLRTKRAGAALPFDDVEDPKTPDKTDDCVLHSREDEDCDGYDRDGDPLNYAYPAEGWEVGVLRDLRKADDAVYSTLVRDMKQVVSVEAMEKALLISGQMHFSRAYDEQMQKDFPDADD